jgi:hypothetical protein
MVANSTYSRAKVHLSGPNYRGLPVSTVADQAKE